MSSALLAFTFAAVHTMATTHPLSTSTDAVPLHAPVTQAATRFEDVLPRWAEAQREMGHGRAAAFTALWSRAEDVTLSGGAGRSH